jgi:hypothetical protein
MIDIPARVDDVDVAVMLTVDKAVAPAAVARQPFLPGNHSQTVIVAHWSWSEPKQPSAAADVDCNSARAVAVSNVAGVAVVRILVVVVVIRIVATVLVPELVVETAVSTTSVRQLFLGLIHTQVATRLHLYR